MAWLLTLLLALSVPLFAQTAREASPFDKYRQPAVSELDFRKVKFDVACIRAAIQQRSLLASGFSAPQVEGETVDGKLLIQVQVYSSELPQTVEKRKETMMEAVDLARVGFAAAFGTSAASPSFEKWTRIVFEDLDAFVKAQKAKTTQPVDPIIGIYENKELVLR